MKSVGTAVHGRHVLAQEIRSQALFCFLQRQDLKEADKRKGLTWVPVAVSAHGVMWCDAFLHGTAAARCHQTHNTAPLMVAETLGFKSHASDWLTCCPISIITAENMVRWLAENNNSKRWDDAAADRFAL